MIPQKTWKKVEHLRESPKILENLQKSPRLGTVGQATRNVCQMTEFQNNTPPKVVLSSSTIVFQNPQTPHESSIAIDIQ
jgi:hypothetical protein